MRANYCTVCPIICDRSPVHQRKIKLCSCAERYVKKTLFLEIACLRSWLHKAVFIFSNWKLIAHSFLTTAPLVVTVVALLHRYIYSVPHNLKRISLNHLPPYAFAKRFLDNYHACYMYLCWDRIFPALGALYEHSSEPITMFLTIKKYCGENGEKGQTYAKHIACRLNNSICTVASPVLSEALFNRPSLLQKRRFVCIAHLRSSNAYTSVESVNAIVPFFLLASIVIYTCLSLVHSAPIIRLD